MLEKCPDKQQFVNTSEQFGLCTNMMKAGNHTVMARVQEFSAQYQYQCSVLYTDIRLM